MQIPKLGKNDRFIQIMEKETLKSINNFKRGHFLEIHFHNKQKKYTNALMENKEIK